MQLSIEMKTICVDVSLPAEVSSLVVLFPVGIVDGSVGVIGVIGSGSGKGSFEGVAVWVPR